MFPSCAWIVLNIIGDSLVSYLRDTLAVLSAVEDGPGDTAGVLALQEERLGFAVLESEHLAVATDVELTLHIITNIVSTSAPQNFGISPSASD